MTGDGLWYCFTHIITLHMVYVFCWWPWKCLILGCCFFLMGSASFRIEKAWCFQVTLNLKTWRWPCCGCSKAIDQPFLTVEFSGAKKTHLCCTVRRISSLRVTGNFSRKTAGKKLKWLLIIYNM